MSDAFHDWFSMSGLWGYQTALDLFLKENGITTLFFGGVNADQVCPMWSVCLHGILHLIMRQCVLGTVVDAYFRGYDCIVVEDITATSSPEGGLANILYNAVNVSDVFHSSL